MGDSHQLLTEDPFTIDRGLIFLSPLLAYTLYTSYFMYYKTLLGFTVRRVTNYVSAYRYLRSILHNTCLYKWEKWFIREAIFLSILPDSSAPGSDNRV